MASASTPVFGIDLGTSESRIAVWKEGKVELIHSFCRGGKNFMPSCVFFAEKFVHVGDSAKKEMGVCPKNFVFDMKRLIGRCDEGSLTKSNMSQWPFKVTYDTGKAEIELENYGKYCPERVMFIVLKRMLNYAKMVWNLEVKQAVMTVPSYFTDAQQKQATKDIADKAKITLISVIDNCTAAALAYCHKNNIKDGYVLVYDMGTYVFVASVISVDLNFKTVHKECLNMLGGRNFDQHLVSHCINEILRCRMMDVRNVEALSKLYAACEEAKKTLSFQDNATISIDNLLRDYNFTCKVSREQFEDMCTDLISASLRITARVLLKAGVKVDQIKHLVMVGGSTRIPKLRSMVKKFFDMEELDHSIEPEETVVYGATVKASLLCKDTECNSTEESGSNEKCEEKEPEEWISEAKEDDEFEQILRRSKRPSFEAVHTYSILFDSDDNDSTDSDTHQFYEDCNFDNGQLINSMDRGEDDTIQRNEERQDGPNETSNIMSERGPAVGIDLGTTCSCIAVWKDGSVKILFNDHGNRVTPSYVAFTEHQRLVGDAAKQQMAISPKNTVFDSKRLIGRKYEEKEVQRSMMSWGFQVVNNAGKPRIEVDYQEEKKRFYPEQISSMVLANLKETAETILMTKVTDAVVTVPAYFNDAQRQATKDAGKIAGLNVLRIINEPTAAAIAYGLENNATEDRNVLVYDLGGGTFDVTVLTVNGLTFTVRSTYGDTHLGGRDFDNRMVDFYVDLLKRRHNKDITGNHKAMHRLRMACEDAKHTLSKKLETHVIVDNICDGIDLTHKISKHKFDDLCDDLFKKTLDIVQQALTDAKLSKDDIEDVVLVGGCTRIPSVQEMVREFFDDKELCQNVNPEEAVANGAAVHAAALHKDHEGHRINEVVLEDVIPMSLGLEVEGHKMSVILPKNTRKPCSMSRLFSTTRNNQRKISIRVFEGENEEVEKNNLLDSFTLTGFPLRPAGEAKFNVTFEVDEDGILSVTAVETTYGKGKSITVTNSRGRFSHEELDEMKREEDRLKQQERIKKDQVTAKSKLESYVYSVKDDLESTGNGISEEQKRVMMRKCKTLLEWIEEDETASKDRFEEELENLKKEWSNINQKK